MTTLRSRAELARSAIVLEQVSMGWMVVEGVASVIAGVLTRSIALTGFGLDSAIELESRALIGDAKETLACAWLSAATVAGVGLHALFGFWWADPVAALAMVPFLVREGREALDEARTGKGCSDCHDD